MGLLLLSSNYEFISSSGLNQASVTRFRFLRPTASPKAS